MQHLILLFHCSLDLQVDGLSNLLPSRPRSPHPNRSVLYWYQVFSFVHILVYRRIYIAVRVKHDAMYQGMA